ncbi:hypothetical protein [Photobacterium nomapromontoriensis]
MAADGDVYNIDNIRIVTPRLHWGEYKRLHQKDYK